MPRPLRPGLDDPRYQASRAELKRVGSHICHRCTYPIDLQLRWPHPASWSADHLVPRSRLNGPDDYRHWHISNLIEAHLRCNQSRGNKPIAPPAGLNTSRRW